MEKPVAPPANDAPQNLAANSPSASPVDLSKIKAEFGRRVAERQAVLAKKAKAGAKTRSPCQMITPPSKRRLTLPPKALKSMSNPAAILKTSWSQRRILKLRLWGVLLISSSNNTIGSDNTASVNSQYGIYLSFSSSNNTIKKNKAKGNTTCDLFHDGSGNILSQNKADCVNGF